MGTPAKHAFSASPQSIGNGNAIWGSFLDGLPLFNSFLRLIVATVAGYLLTGETLFIFFFRQPLTFGVFVV
jgi:hypothetical protein